MCKNVLRALWIIAFWVMVLQLPAYAGSSQSASDEIIQTTGAAQIVVVSGTNYDMGYQYGLQAAALIYQNKLLMNKMLESALGKATVLNDAKVWMYYLEKYDPKLKDWLRGISAGCKSKKFNVNYVDLVLNMVFPQELWARPQDAYPKIAGMKRKKNTLQNTNSAKAHNCSSFGVTNTATKDGKPMITQSAITEVEQQGFVMLVAFPIDGYSFISFPHAGRVAGNHAMNSKGFAWTMNAAPAIHSTWGVTSEVYFHYLAQYCASSSEAQQYLESTPRGGVTGNFIFADASGTMYAFEANGQASAARYPGDLNEKDFVVFSNDFRGPVMTPYNYPVDFLFNSGRYWTIWEHIYSTAEQSAMDVDAIKAVWKSGDWFDKDAGEWHYNDPLNPNVPGNPFGVGGQTQNIFLPADGIVYAQFGSPNGTGWPAYATGEYTKLKILDTVQDVVDAAQGDALSMYLAALDQYLKLVYAGSLDPVLSQMMSDRLDEAYSAWSNALVDEAEAYFSENDNFRMAFYGATLTGYSKAQLYSQMVSTQLNSFAAP